MRGLACRQPAKSSISLQCLLHSADSALLFSCPQVASLEMEEEKKHFAEHHSI